MIGAKGLGGDVAPILMETLDEMTWLRRSFSSIARQRWSRVDAVSVSALLWSLAIDRVVWDLGLEKEPRYRTPSARAATVPSLDSSM
jgi:hypothetical protein